LDCLEADEGQAAGAILKSGSSWRAARKAAKSAASLCQPSRSKIFTTSRPKKRSGRFCTLSPSTFTYESSDWDNFKAINQLFADAACEDAADDALIWIHDYNLWLTPYYIRQKMPNVKIAFFHHTPFPAADVFNILHWREAIVDSLLCCDLCGFHIPRYVENFVGVARSLRDVKTVERGPVRDAFTPHGVALAEPDMTTKLSYQGRTVHLDAFPVGTHPQYIADTVNSDKVQASIKQIRDDIGDNKLIVSAGRVDYVKGAKEMLLCYERLLTVVLSYRAKSIWS
jgi:glucosylglycerol-phosphate synthase